MSPINFDILADEFSEFATTWRTLENWFSKNSHRKFVEFTSLRDDIGDELPSDDFVLALDIMKKLGMVERTTRYRTPDGKLSSAIYSRGEEPSFIPDRFGRQQFPIEDCDPVVCYSWDKVVEHA